MLEVAIPFAAHLSVYEKQEMEMMDELLCMDFDVNTDFEPRNNIETFRKGTTLMEFSLWRKFHILINSYNIFDIASAEIIPAKAANEKLGSKLRRDSIAIKPKRGKRTVSPVPMLEPTKFPNMSRKPRTNILYVFPTFDKCDSLIYFPNTMSRHLNSSDFTGLLKLFNTHLERTCDITFCNGVTPNIKQMVKLFEFMDQIHPDTIMCVHNTKVVENEIFATTYAKFTDCRPLRESVIRNTSDSMAHQMFGDREECFRERMQLNQESDSCKQEGLSTILKSDCDVVVYMKINIRLTFDVNTKKGVKLAFDAGITSLEAME